MAKATTTPKPEAPPAGALKLQVDSAVFGKALQEATRFVPAKSSLPVLTNVLIESLGPSTLRISATNPETSFIRTIDATVAVEGSITLPAHMLTSYVALLDKGQVELDYSPKTHKVHLSCGRNVANIAGIDAEDFPPILRPSGVRVTLPARAMKDAIGLTAFAAAPDDSRPILTGVLVKFGNQQVTLAAADGYRLAVRQVDAPDVHVEGQIIAPARTLFEVARLLPDDDEAMVSMQMDDTLNSASFTIGDDVVVCRLLSGSFPDYQRIIPTETKTVVTVERKPFLQAVKVAAVFAKDNANIIRLATTFGDPFDTLTVASTSAEMGDNAGTLDVDVEGDDTGIAFNGRYLRDALEALDADHVRVIINGPASAGVFRNAGDDNGNVYVIMPMHVTKAK